MSMSNCVRVTRLWGLDRINCGRFYMSGDSLVFDLRDDTKTGGCSFVHFLKGKELDVSGICVAESASFIRSHFLVLDDVRKARLLYISGPMTGIEDYNYPAFREAEERLVEAGFGVRNPAWQVVEEGKRHEDYLALDIETMGAMNGVAPGECGLATLPGIEASKGGQAEIAKAREYGWPIMPLDKWLEEGRRRGAEKALEARG